LFVGDFKKVGSNTSQPFEWIVDDFSQTKQHSSYWYPKHRSSKIVYIGIIILMKSHPTTLDKVAIVLGEKIFGSALYSLPSLLVL
jgi:hypothetical protein